MSHRPLVLDERALTPEQQVVFDRIQSGPRGLVEGPLRVWLQSPALAEHAQSLGAFCRYGTRLPARLSEFAILIVGAHWRSGFEWHVHAPIAAREGVGADAIEALRLGRVPALGEGRRNRRLQFLRRTPRVEAGVRRRIRIGDRGFRRSRESWSSLAYSATTRSFP
jgi:alkylhydroperoxidase family enzyme